MTDNVIAGREERVRLEKKNVSGKLSEICRFIAFGLLAAFYTIFTDDDRFGALIKEPGLPRCLLIAFGMAGAIAVTLDYLQYWAGYRSVLNTLERENRLYDDQHWSYWLREAAFAWKQIVVVVGCVALVAFIVVSSFS